MQAYAEKASQISVKPDCLIGAGYTSDIDIGFNAVDLFAVMQDDLKALKPLTPQIHPQIGDMRSFVETFLYHFKEGQNGEYATASWDLFSELKQYIAKIDTKMELGGHQSVWAVRAQIERCQVYTAPTADDFTIKSITYQHADGDYLHIPREILAQSKPNESSMRDEHLVFEYNQGDTIMGFTATRSNRLYFDNDPFGGNFVSMEHYHTMLDQVSVQPYRHMFGGYQLMQGL